MDSTSSTTTHRMPVRLQSNEDLKLLKTAHSVSAKISDLAQRNSLQSDLLSSLDSFILSIENKLDQIETFFHNNTPDDTLQSLYDTLITIKRSAFPSNLESLNAVLGEHYEALATITADLNVHEKLLTGLHFLDAKIDQFNHLVELKQNHIDPIRQFQIKFHNYEHAVAHGSSRLLHYYELPFPWRENQYIVHGYRFQNHHLHALQSICSCHNETSNIWTHLLGGFVMLYICFVSYPSSELYLNSGFQQNLMIYLYLIASIKCLLSSTIWHTFNGTSSLYLRQKFACIDYTGITILITAAIVTTEYSALYYFPIIRLGFITFSLFCGIVGFFFNWSSYFDRPESKPLRVAFYLSLSGLGFSAFGILAYHKGIYHALQYYSPIARSSIWYLIGVVFYSTLVPERFRTDVIRDTEQPEQEDLISDHVYDNLESYFKKEPIYSKHNGFWSLWWVDYVFASHNIWHIFVLLGILGHYTAIYEMFTNIPFNK